MFRGFLQANTETVVRIGPFLDVTDGVTPETAVALTGGGDPADEAELLKAGSGATGDISANTFAAIANCDGWYNLTLTVGNLDTEGLLTIVVQNDSLHKPVDASFMVLAQAAFVSMFTAKDAGFMDVNIKTVGRADTQETEANNLESACSNYSATRGLSGTALPAAAADAAGGLPISDAGGLDMDAIKAKTDNLPSSIPKAVALANFSFALFSNHDHVTPLTGASVSPYISKDGGAFAACSNAVTAIGSGVYKITLTATETDADILVLRFTATGADDVLITIKTDS